MLYQLSYSPMILSSFGLSNSVLGRMEAATDAQSRVDLLREVARLFEHEVGDLGKAFHTLRAAYRELPSAEETASELERLAAATGQWSDLIRDYTERVDALFGTQLTQIGAQTSDSAFLLLQGLTGRRLRNVLAPLLHLDS